MKLISFEHAGQPGFGVVTGDGIIDATRHLAGRYADLRGVLQADALSEVAALASRVADLGLDAVQFRPVIDNPAARFFCVGINYMPHIREMGRERPEYPVIFVRYLSSLVGHERPLIKPAASEQYDFEGELAVILGRPARHVARQDAYDYVAGYSCFNDGSVRDYQRHGAQWTPGKNFESSGSFGPWMISADDAGRPQDMQLKTTLNGEVVQSESVGELCFGIPELIEYISTWTELQAGDVIVSGTPGGVGAGRNPPLWMRPGDTVEVDISGVGSLRNTVCAEDEA
jgi:2-keto-4-pentenoate hydratase/2-oxohepta-3-ene-1,7-dioic acid hydratase in catechol pathway